MTYQRHLTTFVKSLEQQQVSHWMSIDNTSDSKRMLLMSYGWYLVFDGDTYTYKQRNARSYMIYGNHSWTWTLSSSMCVWSTTRLHHRYTHAFINIYIGFFLWLKNEWSCLHRSYLHLLDRITSTSSMKTLTWKKHCQSMLILRMNWSDNLSNENFTVQLINRRIRDDLYEIN